VPVPELVLLAVTGAAAAWGAGFLQGARQGRRAGWRTGTAEAALRLRERALGEAHCPVCGAPAPGQGEAEP
jgi:hypothetical protein